jgi:hypothetical protein
MNQSLRLTKLYNYPAHAVRVFDRVVNEQATLGRSLLSVTKGHFLGCGVSLKFEFAPGNDMHEYRLVYCWGHLRDVKGQELQDWNVNSKLPMKVVWITIGYFFVLSRLRNAA